MMVQVRLLFLLILPIVSEAFDIGGHDFAETTFAYRKKPNTPVEGICFPQTPEIICDLTAEFCGAFHVGENFYVTPAHCLVGIDG